MSYTTNLGASQQESTPEMYIITSGSTTKRYTSYPSDVTFLGNLYSAVSIKRTGISQSMELGSATITVSTLLDGDIFKKYINNQPIEPTRIEVYSAITSDLSSYVVVFKGQVKYVTIDNNQVNAKCEARSDALDTRIPRFIYQSYCNNDIFDSGCGLNEATYKVAGTVSSVSGHTIVSSAWGNAAGYEDDYFKGGRVVYGTDMRLVVDHTNETLTLQIPFGSEVAAGVAVNAYPGCDGSPQTCKNKFNNLIAGHMGMSYIPSRNPVIFGF